MMIYLSAKIPATKAQVTFELMSYGSKPDQRLKGYGIFYK